MSKDLPWQEETKKELVVSCQKMIIKTNNMRFSCSLDSQEKMF